MPAKKIIQETEIRDDSLKNLMTGMGTDRDKRTYTTFKRKTQGDVGTIDTVVVDDDIIHNIVFIPAKDMTREWIDLQGEIGSQVEKELQRIKAQRAFYEAIAWQRAYGSSLIVVGVSNQPTRITEHGDVVVDYSKPLKVGGKVEWLQVFDRYEVSDVKFDASGNIETYTINVGASKTKANYQEVHASRILRFDGEPMPRRRRELGDWGQSIVMRAIDVVADYESAVEGCAVAMQDFNLIILRLKDLTKMLAADKEGIARKRIGEMDLMRSLFRMLTLDSEDSHEIQSRNFGGVSEIIDRLAERVATVARMPLSLLLGRAPAGLNATGDSDLRWWYDNVKSEQETKMREPLQKLIEIICASIGVAAEDVPVPAFVSLWQPTQQESAQTHLTQAQADSIYLTAGVVDPDEIAKSRFGPTGYSVETQVDSYERDIDVSEEDIASTNETENETETEKPDKQQSTNESSSDMIKPAPPTSTMPASAAVLNGAQVTSMQGTVMAVASGELPRESGVAILQVGFNLTKEQAESVIGSAGGSFIPASQKNQTE
jgi:phage-related protein (TIGR01555 family)